MDWLVLCLAFIIILILFKSDIFKSSKLPPGPTPLPVIGNLFYIARQHSVNYLALHKISKKYGTICSLKIGSNNNILLSTCDTAKDILSRTECLDRPNVGSILDRTLHQNIGMLFSNGDGWNDIRKFTSRTFREYGFGNKNAMEMLIRDELFHLTEYIETEVAKTTDGVLHFDMFFQTSFLNLVTSTMTGKRYEYDDVELKRLVQASKDWFATPVMGVLIIMAYPWMRYVCPKILGYTQQMDALNVMHNGMRKILKDHRDKNQFMENPSCFTDSFLKMAHERKSDPTTTSLFTDDQFAVLGTDLLQAGSDTSSTWLSWAILLLTVHPETQNKLVKEIERVVGFQRFPEYADKDRMVYAQAVILEVHRYCRMLVVGPPRVVSADFNYQNYLIKKGTMVIVNLHSCYMDPDFWDSPEEFRPERFLSSDSTALANTDKMSIIFGTGRRNCFGESMAKESTFLYLTTLLQKFSLHTPPVGYPSLDTEPVPGISLTPKPYYIQIRKRNS